MSQWKVFRRVPVWLPDYPWRTVNEKTRETAIFPTWREAMNHADLMARTLEVVVPRGLSVEDGAVDLYDNGGVWADIETHNRAVHTSIGYWSVKDCLEEHGAALIVLARSLKAEEVPE